MDVNLPKIGLTMEEGKVIRWLADEGQHLAAGEALVEIETEKVVVEVPAPVAGVLASILIQNGQTVPVGSVICRIEASDDSNTQARPVRRTRPGASSGPRSANDKGA